MGATSISPWLDEPSECAPPLQGMLDADVAVIGAGLSGLSTAIALRAAGMKVAVLEAQYAGFGASGRNAGHLTPTIGKDLPTLTKLFGNERVRELVHLVDRAIRHVESTIAEHAIDCHYEPVGNVVAAVHPRQHPNLDRAAAAAAKYGVPGTLFEPDEMRRRGLPAHFTRGYFEPHGGILQPGLYARGLRRVALERGAQLFEKTPVVRVEETLPAIVHAPGGHVRARHVVLATNAYTPSLGFLRSMVMPVHVQLFETEPLSDAQMRAVGWQERQGIYTAHEMLESYRLTKDNRIVGGAKLVRYGYRGKLLADTDSGIARVLETTFRHRFPELRDLPIARHWGGPIAFALDFLPLLGRDGPHRNILHAVVYAGHGVALASYAGTMIADLLLGRDDGAGKALATRWQVPLPPEPLRWLTVRALTGIFSRIDQKADGFDWYA